LIEEMLRFHARGGGPHCLVLRISNAYGPSVREHVRQGVVQAFLERVRSGETVRIWGNGEAVRDYVHVDDVMGALGILLQRGMVDEVFNLGSGTETSMRELLAVIERVTGKSVVVEHVEGEYAGVRRNLLDVSKLRARTGWSPRVGLEEGIARLWKTIVR
jgi:UDP-glucose 4-epimerase